MNIYYITSLIPKPLNGFFSVDTVSKPWYEYCMAKKKRHKDSNESEVWIDEASYLPDELLQENPYVNTVTKEVRYMSIYEYYMTGMGFYISDPEHREYGDWKRIQDSQTLRLLYNKKDSK